MSGGADPIPPAAAAPRALPIDGVADYRLLTPMASVGDVDLVVAGHSHVMCVVRALSLPGADRLPVGVVRGGPVADAHWQAVAAVAPSRAVAVVWDGNQHNADFLVSADGGFDLRPRGYPGPAEGPAGLPLVPEAALREHFRQGLAPMREALGRIPAGGPRAVVGTPPPFGEGIDLLERIGREEGLMRRMARAGLDLGSVRLTPRRVLHRLWWVLQATMAEAAAGIGWDFVPSPAAAQDADGFLRADLSAGDATHANAAYGAILIGHMLDWSRAAAPREATDA